MRLDFVCKDGICDIEQQLNEAPIPSEVANDSNWNNAVFTVEFSVASKCV